MAFKNKTSISVLILLLSVILLLFVIGVYAHDNDTTITNGTDINTTINNESIREVNVHNWNELKIAVDNLTAHPCEKLIINLDEGDYKINTAEIQVKKGQNVVINGNGHTIDCNKKHFMDISNYGEVTINDLVIQNARVIGSNAGAILNGGVLTINNSILKDNHADSFGGAIYNRGTLNVYGSTFTDNYAHDYGGAIFNEKVGTLTVTDSTFRNNKVGYDGGAICIHGGKVNPIKNCTFKNNIAENSYKGDGGAIEYTGNNNPLIVTDCQFISNNAAYGGAIDCRVLQIRNCEFTQNKALNYNGGAVNCNDLNECHDCNFTDNYANDYGGAISIMEKAGKNNIKDCIFKDNKATSFGGAIFVNRQAAHISLIHNQFINNHASDKDDNVYNWGHYDKIEHNYFPNKDQNKFREWGFFKDKNHKDNSPFYNLEDYYRWKG